MQTVLIRALAATAILGIVATSSYAAADPWRARPALTPDSPIICRQADLTKVVFDFAQTGTELSGRTNNGHGFSTPVGSDGSVSTTITVPVDGKEFAVDLTGNARSRALQVFNKRYSCRFTLTPVQ